MRVIIYGLGAVGGTIAARLALTGTEVAGIARGAMLDALRAQGGLTLMTPSGTDLARFACYGSPAEVGLRPDDVILLTMKSQDTEAALLALHAAGARDQTVVCAQNGVDNERMALRHFANVCGMVIMLPAQYTTPGVVQAFGAPKSGLFDLGRYPSGGSPVAEALAAALDRAGFDCALRDAVMAYKYGKLLLNTGNMVGAAFGTAARKGDWAERARAEAEAAYAAAGIAAADVGEKSYRRELMQPVPIPGVTHVGSSSQQSLSRGAGSIETDFLNGEIALLGRLHGVPTPVNTALCEAARRMLRDKIPMGSFPEAEFEALL
jgi:2-dehydropantoate 2-reductase